jgi:hypothetical protein
MKYGAEINSKVKGMHAIDIELDIGGNIDVGFLLTYVYEHEHHCVPKNNSPRWQRRC